MKERHRTPKLPPVADFILRAFYSFGVFASGIFRTFFFRAGFCKKGPFSRIRLGSNALVLRFYQGRIPRKWPILQVIHAEPPTIGGGRRAIIGAGSPPFKKTAPELQISRRQQHLAQIRREIRISRLVDNQPRCPHQSKMVRSQNFFQCALLIFY